jgi:hypothetical protein
MQNNCLEKVHPWTAAGMSERREVVFEKIRQSVKLFFDEDGRWRDDNEGRDDPRVYVQISLPLLLGNNNDQALARTLLDDDVVKARINHCSFTTEYLMAVINGMGEKMPEDLRDVLRNRVKDGILHYAKKDLQHHGYNDNHVTLATSSLIIGGQFVGNEEAIEQGRLNLLNFRDTFLRRGFMHETNDCYIPHTLYSTAMVAEFAEDREIRELALNCEARIWADWIGHWHLNLSRKPGPSARDYTFGRLNPMSFNIALWCILGDRFASAVYPYENIFKTELPSEQYFSCYNKGDMFWNMGFLARMMAHSYHIPEEVAKLAYHRDYPHIIKGTHEVGHFNESVSWEMDDGHKGKHLMNQALPFVVPFSGREIYTYQYQEKDWAMGTASQRMIGNCPNNNWGVYYRKADPLVSTKDQGMIFCSFTINDKNVSGSHDFEMLKDNPQAVNHEDFVHWFDNGHYAGMQHEGTSIMLYRPRVHEMHKITSLSTTLVFPLTFKNRVEHIYFGDKEIVDFDGECAELDDIFIEDGFVYVGIKPLLSRPQSSPIRMKASKQGECGLIDLYSYMGREISLTEMDLCRIGGGFLCEVRNKDDFDSIEDFRKWFSAGRVLDDQTFFMRQVRYHRDDLDMAMRYDVWGDNIMYRMLNGREMEKTKFSCSGIDNQSLPWLCGDVSGLDHFSWAFKQSERELAEHCIEPGKLCGKGVF